MQSHMLSAQSYFLSALFPPTELSQTGMAKVYSFLAVGGNKIIGGCVLGSNSTNLFIVWFPPKTGHGVLFVLYQFISLSTDLVNGSQQPRNQCSLISLFRVSPTLNPTVRRANKSQLRDGAAEMIRRQEPRYHRL